MKFGVFARQVIDGFRKVVFFILFVKIMAVRLQEIIVVVLKDCFLRDFFVNFEEVSNCLFNVC